MSPKSFKDPAKVVHIDRVYVDSLQPDIMVSEVMLTFPDGREEVIMKDGKWVV